MTSIKKALLRHLSCGTSGVETLLQEGYPLPAVRTLRHHLSSFNFKAGLLPEVFDLFKLKDDNVDPHERFCIFTIDEVALKPSTEYDVKADQVIGQATIPGHEGEVSKALVYTVV